jgi:arylsulfatase A-like enzyme
VQRINDIGTARSYSNYPIGWAQALNTPFRSWKADANAEGGTRNPLIAYWPKGNLPKGEVRGQFGHVIDLLPTTLEIAKATTPDTLHGVKQDPVQGESLAASFSDPNATTRSVQHSLIFGAGAIRKDGWKASFAYRPDYVDIFQTYPIPTDIPNNAGKEVWELYNLNVDFNELNNLAAKNPAKLKELQAEFDKQAEANNLYPIINWSDVTVRAREFLSRGGRVLVVPKSASGEPAGGK